MYVNVRYMDVQFAMFKNLSPNSETVQCYSSSEDCASGRDSFTLRSMSDCCLLLQAQSFSFPNDDSGLCHDCIGQLDDNLTVLLHFCFFFSSFCVVSIVSIVHAVSVSFLGNHL